MAAAPCRRRPAEGRPAPPHRGGPAEEPPALRPAAERPPPPRPLRADREETFAERRRKTLPTPPALPEQQEGPQMPVAPPHHPREHPHKSPPQAQAEPDIHLVCSANLISVDHLFTNMKDVFNCVHRKFFVYICEAKILVPINVLV